ncbi:hypothetical protein J2S43_004844 [Catenuloplanes nepalensis]|uniref:Lipoprotein n=1 Tax=Catenuloplanes nepalensis TaxID=587533 RepID=A0ABT9MY13_9ACTN|nr:hypothetical protein [Catenuloplanes nepalensis]
MTTNRRIARAVPAALLGAVLALSLAACSGEGYDTQCGLDQCTVTFDRGANASASVLGIEAKLVEVQGQVATFEVAGEQIGLTVGQAATEVGGFLVQLESLTDTQAAIEISVA